MKKCRKPGSWWQNHETGGGLSPNGKDPAKAGPGSTCRGKALCAVDVAPFDEGAAEPALVPRCSRVLRGSRTSRGATESVRGRSPAWHAADNAVAKQPAHAVLSSSPREARRGRHDRSWRCDVNRASTRGWATLKTWLGAAAVFRLRLKGRAVGTAHAVRSGTRTVLGCSFRRSVAEVGKKHLPSRTRGEPRGELKLRPGSTYRRRSPDKKRHPGTGERVRASRANLNREREPAHSIARSRIEPTEGVLRLGISSRFNRRGEVEPLARRSSRWAR